MSDSTSKENNDDRRSEDNEKDTERDNKSDKDSRSRSGSRGRYSDDDNNKSSKESEKPRYNNKYNAYRPDKNDYRCCSKCLGNKDKRDCACLIPSSKRRSNIGKEGCRMCGCRGCHPDDNSNSRRRSRSRSSSYHRGHRKSRRSDSRSYSRSRSRSSSYRRSGHKRSYRSRSRSSSNRKLNDRDLKNGCCKKCMKAFAGRACACQVPSAHRKTDLSKNGCYHCGCKGCSPADLKD